MAEPPINPYAPSQALAHDVAAEEKVPVAGQPSRLGAVAVALFAQPIAGAGFYLLGERRRFVAWTALVLGIRALLVIAVWTPLPRLCTIAFVAMLAASLGSVLHTAITKPRRPPLKRGALVGVLFIAGGIATGLAMNRWVVESFQIPAGSMMPALVVGDHILIKKGNGNVQRGDVIVFKFPGDQSTDYIKRVVAVGGDTVEVRDGVPSINGVPLDHQPIDEPCSYRDDASPIPDEHGEPCALVRETNAGRTYTIMLAKGATAPDHPRTIVPPDTFFMLGDNRDNSYDSRRWGTVRTDLVKGKATVIWWSRGVGKTDVRWSRVGRGIE